MYYGVDRINTVMLYCGVDRGEKHNCAVNIFDNDCIVQCIVELTDLTELTATVLCSVMWS